MTPAGANIHLRQRPSFLLAMESGSGPNRLKRRMAFREVSNKSSAKSATRAAGLRPEPRGRP